MAASATPFPAPSLYNLPFFLHNSSWVSTCSLNQYPHVLSLLPHRRAQTEGKEGPFRISEAVSKGKDAGGVGEGPVMEKSQKFFFLK